MSRKMPIKDKAKCENKYIIVDNARSLRSAIVAQYASTQQTNGCILYLFTLSVRVVFNKFNNKKKKNTKNDVETRSSNTRANKQTKCVLGNAHKRECLCDKLPSSLCVHECCVLFVLHALIYLFHIFVNVFAHEDDADFMHALNASHMEKHIFPKLKLKYTEKKTRTDTVRNDNHPVDARQDKKMVNI